MNKVILLIIGMILFYSCSEPDEKKGLSCSENIYLAYEKLVSIHNTIYWNIGGLFRCPCEHEGFSEEQTAGGRKDSD